MGIESVFCYYNYNQPFVEMTLSAGYIPRKSQTTLSGSTPRQDQTTLSGHVLHQY